MKLENILTSLKALKPKYEKEGFLLIGVFGSLSRGEDSLYSDIDIAYKLDHKLFSMTYKDGFSKLLRIEEVKETLEKNFHQKVDLISLNSKNRGFLESIEKDIVYV